MRVAKLKSAYNLLIMKNDAYLQNYVSCPFPVDTCGIWPQMHPWSSCITVLFIASSENRITGIPGEPFKNVLAFFLLKKTFFLIFSTKTFF